MLPSGVKPVFCFFFLEKDSLVTGKVSYSKLGEEKRSGRMKLHITLYPACFFVWIFYVCPKLSKNHRQSQESSGIKHPLPIPFRFVRGKFNAGKETVGRLDYCEN